MKVLLVNNFYYNRGGDCTYLLALKHLLEAKGHKVFVFSMEHPQNIISDCSQYFVSYINYAEEAKSKNLYSGLKVMKRSIYSVEAKMKMERCINDLKPDIVHLNNIRHHLTPSILFPIRKENIPVVWTLHDYQLICPNISFLSRGKICEKCKKRRYYWPILTRCKKNSFLASAMAAVEHTAQIIMSVYDAVDIFIAPSRFLRNKFIEYGFDEDKIIYLKHFIDIDLRDEDVEQGDYVLYIGRLSDEKGIKTLVDAVVNMEAIKLKIVGDGPLRHELLSELKQNEHGRIELLGHRSHDDVMDLIRKSRYVVVPSEWYEVFGLVILEAFACCKPVVGSRIGAIPELIKDNENGFLFEPGNSSDLSSKMIQLEKHPDKILEMGKAGRAFVKTEFGSDKYYHQIIHVYEKAAEKKRTAIYE